MVPPDPPLAGELAADGGPVRIELAGTIAIEAERKAGQESLSGWRSRLAFLYLTLERGRSVPREEIAGALWGDRLPESWGPSLREVMSKVRSFLAAAGLPSREILTSAHGCYRLDLPGRTEVDLEEAERAVTSAEGLLAQGRAAEAVGVAREAAELFSRPLLAGVEGDWLEARRRELEGWRSRALRTLAEAAMEEAPAEAIEAARTAIELSPFSDRAHLTLIESHVAEGGRAEALRAYDTYRRLLASELGVGPSAEVERRFRELLEGSDRPADIARPDGLIGRDSEIARLSEMLDGAIEGRGGLAVLAGPSGMGKTALLAELERAAVARGVPALRGSAADGAPGLLSVIHEALGSTALPGIKSAAGDPRLVAASLAEALASRAEGNALLVVLDDLHLADSVTLAALAELARSPEPPAGVLLAGGIDTAPGTVGEEAGTLLSLEAAIKPGPLDRDSLEELGRRAGLDGLGTALLAETGGNPLHAIEAIRHLAESGPVGRDVTGATVPFGDLALPPSMDELAFGRIARLPEPSRQLLETTAILGGSIEFELAARLTGWSRREVGLALETAAAAGFVVREEGAPARIRLAHDLYRRAILERMPEAKLRRRHAAAAMELELRGDAGTERVAGQWVRAGAAEDGDRGARYAQMAGKRALADSAYIEAVSWFTAGLRQLPADGPDGLRMELLIALADALKLSGEIARAEGRYQEAADLARNSGDPDDLARVAIACAGFNRFEPSISPGSMALLDEASRAEGVGAAARVRLLARRAQFSAAMGGGAELEVDTSEAVSGTSADDPATRIQALAARLHVLGGPERCEERLRTADELAALAHTEEEIEPELTAIEHRIWALTELGEHSRARGEIDRFAGIASRLRIPVIEMFAAQHGSYLAMIEGRFEDGERFADRVAEAASRSADPRMSASSKVLAQLVPRWLQGTFATLAPAVEAIAGWQPEMESFAASRAMALLESGRQDEAAEAFEALIESGSPQGPPHGSLWSFDFFYHAVLAHRLEHPAAGQVYERGREYGGMHCVYRGLVYCGAYDHHLGRLAAVTGERDLAREHLEAAREAYRPMAATPWLGLASRDLDGLA